jgi:hypothetical protein
MNGKFRDHRGFRREELLSLQVEPPAGLETPTTRMTHIRPEENQKRQRKRKT